MLVRIPPDVDLEAAKISRCPLTSAEQSRGKEVEKGGGRVETVGEGTGLKTGGWSPLADG